MILAFILGSLMRKQLSAEHDDSSRSIVAWSPDRIDLVEYCCVNAVLLPTWTT